MRIGHRVTNCWGGKSTTIVHSKDYVAAGLHMTGTSRSNVDGGAFDQMSLECVGVFRSEKGAPTADAVCEYLDKDGDKLLGYAERTGVAGGKWRFVSGTGKYAGISGGGEYEYLGRFPRIRDGHVQGCNRAAGNYELKR